jgi:tetratricopeptide (TPR) repeat protein
LTSYFCRTGDPNRAIEMGQRAISLVEPLGDISLHVTSNYHLANAYHSSGDYVRAIDYFKRNVDSLGGKLAYERFGQPGLSSVLARTWMAWCLAERGNFADGLIQAEEGVPLAEKANDPFSLATAHFGVGTVCLRKGDLDRAVTRLERCLEISDIGIFRLWGPWVASNLGIAHALIGNADKGLSLLQQAIDQAANMGLVSFKPLWIAWLGQANLLAGRIDNALPLAGQALDLSRKHKERGSEAWALRLLGDIHSHPDAIDAEKADENYRQALALAEELGMRPLIAHCRKGLGALYGRTGQEDKARTELTAAMDMYREMEMTFFLEQAEAAMAEAG